MHFIVLLLSFDGTLQLLNFMKVFLFDFLKGILMKHMFLFCLILKHLKLLQCFLMLFIQVLKLIMQSDILFMIQNILYFYTLTCTRTWILRARFLHWRRSYIWVKLGCCNFLNFDWLIFFLFFLMDLILNFFFNIFLIIYHNMLLNISLQSVIFLF